MLYCYYRTVGDTLIHKVGSRFAAAMRRYCGAFSLPWPFTIRQYNRGDNLSLRDGPELTKKAIGYFPRQEYIPVLLIKPDGPPRSGPSPDQDGVVRQCFKMSQKPRANACVTP